MAKVNYLLNRNGIYYFRMPFPLNIIDFVGKREFKLSLRTSNKQEALSICTSLTCKARELCHTLNFMKQADYPISKKLALKFFEERLKFYFEFIKKQNEHKSNYRGLSLMQVKTAQQDFNEARLSSNYSKFSSRFDDFITANGVDLPNEEAKQKLYEFLLKGNFDAIMMADALNHGITDHIPEYAPFNEHRLVPKTTYTEAQTIDAAPVDEETLYELIDKYLEHRNIEVERTLIEEGTLEDDKYSLSMLRDLVDNSIISEVRKPQMRELRDKLENIPKNQTKTPKYKKYSLRELSEMTIEAKDKASVGTINKRISNIEGFFNWLKDEGYYNFENPMKGLKLKDNERAKDKRDSFTAQDIKTIYESPMYTGSSNYKRKRHVAGKMPPLQDDIYWFLLVALYTGARLSEIYNLTQNDIKQTSDIKCFSFNEDGDKKVKTKNSIRDIPIHKQLIELGFLEFVNASSKAGNKLIFANISSADAASKAFSRLLKKLDIKTDKKSFHSYRHTLIDNLRALGAPKDISQAIVGHANNKDVHANYGTTNIETLNTYLQKVDFGIKFKA